MTPVSTSWVLICHNLHQCMNDYDETKQKFNDSGVLMMWHENDPFEQLDKTDLK